MVLFGQIMSEIILSSHSCSLSQMLTFNNVIQFSVPTERGDSPQWITLTSLHQGVTFRDGCLKQQIHLLWINPSDVNTAKDRDSLKWRAILFLRRCSPEDSCQHSPSTRPTANLDMKHNLYFLKWQNLNVFRLWKHLLPLAGPYSGTQGHILYTSVMLSHDWDGARSVCLSSWLAS